MEISKEEVNALTRVLYGIKFGVDEDEQLLLSGSRIIADLYRRLHNENIISYNKFNKKPYQNEWDLIDEGKKEYQRIKYYLSKMKNWNISKEEKIECIDIFSSPFQLSQELKQKLIDFRDQLS